MAGNIEISTAHNIVVSYELGSLADRILATLADLGVMLVVSFLIAGIGSMSGLTFFSTIVSFALVTFYHLLFEIFNKGQSPGKMLMKLKVVNLKSAPPSVSEAFQRWVFRLIDLSFTMGTLASLFIISSNRNQRLGDLIGECVVIKLKKNNDVSMERVRRIQERKRKILYPLAARYSEGDMLIVKEVLDRNRVVNNRSTNRAMEELSAKISDDIGLTQPPEDRRLFLEDILKDYVSLTR